VAGSLSAYVLDSFALLAYLEGEAGMSRVRSILTGAEARRHTVYLSLINLGEALYITERERGIVEAVARSGPSISSRWRLWGFRGRRCWRRPTSRPLPHLVRRHVRRRRAQDLRGVVVTGDPEFRRLAAAGLVTVEWLPRRQSVR